MPKQQLHFQAAGNFPSAEFFYSLRPWDNESHFRTLRSFLPSPGLSKYKNKNLQIHELRTWKVLGLVKAAEDTGLGVHHVWKVQI